MSEMTKSIRDQRGFTEGGSWYKGNIHCHTTVSDGSLTPESVADLYRRHGYSFLAISDHDVFTDFRSELDRDDFIILPAVESSAVLYADEEKARERRLAVHHIHGLLGNQEMVREAKRGPFRHLEYIPPLEYIGCWTGSEAAQKLTDRLLDHGCIAIYNHPVWSRIGEEDFIHTKGLCALEVYNYGTVNESGTGYDEIRWDVMLRQGTHIWATASDDNHNDGILKDSFGGYIMAKAEKLDHESLINAIISGNYYSSTGPQIYDWGIHEGKAYICCSAVSAVYFIAGNLINAGGAVFDPAGNDSITEAAFSLKGNESYVRAVCTDSHGHKAWSNPLYL